MIRSKQWIRSRLSRPQAFNCGFPEIRVHKFAHKCHGHWLLMQAQAKKEIAPTCGNQTQIIPNPILFASHMSPHVLNESKWTIKTPASQQKKHKHTSKKRKKSHIIYIISSKIFINQVSFKSSLSYLLPSNPFQGSNQCIRGSTGPPDSEGPVGGAGGPLGPRRFTNSGGMRVPGDPGDPPWPMANGWPMGVCFVVFFLEITRITRIPYSAFRRFFDGIDGKNAYIDCSFLEKQVCSSPNIIKSCRH